MKKIICFILALLIMLTACSKNEQVIDEPEKIEENEEVFENEETLKTQYEDIRNFCLSKEATKAVIETIASNKEIEDCEICALYQNVVTFKISGVDSSLKFYTFEVLPEKNYSLELLSERTFDRFEKDCEFFPVSEDGYPRSAFSTISPYSFISSEISSVGVFVASSAISSSGST